MMLAMQQDLNDAFTIGGFVVGLAGIAYTAYQVRKGVSAATAAKIAAEQTLTESKNAVNKLLIGMARSHFNELKRSIEKEDWIVVKLRCEDLADLISQTNHPATETGEITAGLRELSAVFHRKSKGAGPRLVDKKLRELIGRIHLCIDTISNPHMKG
jgi:hypothetical protein